MKTFENPVQEMKDRVEELSAFARNINENKLRETLKGLNEGEYGKTDSANVRLLSEFLSVANQLANEIKKQSLDEEMSEYVLPAFINKMSHLIELQTKYNYLYNEIAFGAQGLRNLFQEVKQGLATDNQENSPKGMLHAFNHARKKPLDVSEVDNTFAKFVQFSVHMKNVLVEISKSAQDNKKQIYADYVQAISKMMELANQTLGAFQDAQIKPYQMKGQEAIKAHNDFALRELQLKRDFKDIVKDFHKTHPLQQGHAVARQAGLRKFG